MYSISRKALVAVILSCALLASFASPGSADSKGDLERQKKGVSGKIDGAKKDLDDTSKQYAVAATALKKAQTSLDSAQNHLSSTRGRLAVANAKDMEMQAALTAGEAAFAKAKAELSDGESSLAASEVQVKQFALETLREGDRGLRAFGDLLRGQSPIAFSEQMSLNNSVGDAQLATMQRLDASKVILSLNRDRVRKLRDEVAAKRKQAAANLVTQESLEAQAVTQTVQVTKLVGARATAVRSANSARKADAAQLAALEADRNSLSARLRALAAREASKEAVKGGGGGSSAGGDGGSALSYPVNGPITSRYGMRVHPITGVYKLHDGTDFGVGCGTPIYAAASGRVLERYYNGGYGNRLIVNHGRMRGASVVTAYNHAARYIVSAGERVSRGQKIGYVGSTGYSTGCHMHFMVLVNGNTVNPMGWL
ncbi:MAG: peptidoglycan DD-metalloendopeptidase family protein [Kineosporiaceae bacterium]|nr:peptidoglycan DD-metalloendopeptidase family protein [Aeromicrobium sp.]